MALTESSVENDERRWIRRALGVSSWACTTNQRGTGSFTTTSAWNVKVQGNFAGIRKIRSYIFIISLRLSNKNKKRKRKVDQAENESVLGLPNGARKWNNSQETPSTRLLRSG